MSLADALAENSRRDIQHRCVRILLDLRNQAVEGCDHLLTFSAQGQTPVSIFIDSDEDTIDDVDALVRLAVLLDGPDPVGVIVRTIHDDEFHECIDGTAVEMATMRGWRFDGEQLNPITASNLFASMWTDSDGEPMAPASGVNYVTSWPADWIG
jgi:hypothetical protein